MSRNNSLFMIYDEKHKHETVNCIFFSLRAFNIVNILKCLGNNDIPVRINVNTNSIHVYE